MEFGLSRSQCHINTNLGITSGCFHQITKLSFGEHATRNALRQDAMSCGRVPRCTPNYRDSNGWRESCSSPWWISLRGTLPLWQKKSVACTQPFYYIPDKIWEKQEESLCFSYFDRKEAFPYIASKYLVWNTSLPMAIRSSMYAIFIVKVSLLSP